MKSGFNTKYVGLLSIIVALGGFLLGFDSAVIAGAVPLYSKQFGLDQSSIWFGFSVGALTIGSIVGNLLGGVLADKFGRKIVLIGTSILFAFCALGSALTNNFSFFIISRLVGGLGVGMAILVAPMYIAEVSPSKYRGTMVSVNQLNIVLGISIAFFSNYIINRNISNPDLAWRWMLGVGAVPALLYFLLLFLVPQSPRWLIQRNRKSEAVSILSKIGGDLYSREVSLEIQLAIENDSKRSKTYFRELFSKEAKMVLIIGLGIAFLQQISAINAILYYAPIIFETAGNGRNAAFMEAVMLGLVNVVFTVVSMFLIDRLGRKPLLIIGLTGIILAYVMSSAAFYRADYQITPQTVQKVETVLAEHKTDPKNIAQCISGIEKMQNKTYSSELAFFKDVKINTAEYYPVIKETVLKSSIHINAYLVLIGILLFMASFAISLGPVTWALLSEIFPMRVRGLAISVAGTFNALVSAAVVTIFPTELATLGSGNTFAIFAVICLCGLLFVIRFIPETKGKSLEELEKELMR
jgi:sugar porter (SP) family MFS transporter